MNLKKRRVTTNSSDFSKSPSAERAYNSLLRRISRRDFSETELITKLSQWYEDAAVKTAIQKAKDYNLIKPNEELAARWAESLNRRGKGALYIQQNLKKRGLPAVTADHDTEVEKCGEWIKKKWGDKTQFTYEERGKVYRYLTTRGFKLDTIKKAIEIKLQAEK